VPRLPFFRLFVPRLSKQPVLPVTRSPPIRLTPSTSRGFRQYAPLRQESPPPSSPGASTELPENASMTARLKVLIKSYGWYALGVYLAIGAVDFTIAFAAINFFGAEQVGRVTAQVKGKVLDMIHGSTSEDSPDGRVNGRETAIPGGSEGLAAMVLLAWTVHKTLFLPLRAGVTVAVTPKLVRWLRMKGWTGTGGATRAATHLRDKMKRNRD
jgi:N-terminal acetyltransferase 2